MWLLTNKFQHCYQSLKDGFFYRRTTIQIRQFASLGTFWWRNAWMDQVVVLATTPRPPQLEGIAAIYLWPCCSPPPPPLPHQPRPPVESTSGNLKEGTSNKLVHSMWINLLCGRIVSVYVKQTSSKLMKNRSTIWGANQTELSWTRLL